MKRYILFVLLVAAIQVGILLGISFFFDTDLLNTMFLGSCVFIIFAFLMSSSGDALSKNSEVAVFNTFLGSYKPKHEEAKFAFNPLVTGSLLTLAVYFGVYHFFF